VAQKLLLASVMTWGQGAHLRLLSDRPERGLGDIQHMNVIRHVRDNQFLRHNAVFFAGSLAVGALNYLYYPVLGRLLSPGTFGEVQTLVTLFLQLGVFLVVLSQVIVNIVANYESQARVNALVFEFEKLALLVSAALLCLALLFGRQLQSWLNFTSAWPFAVLGLAVLASVPFYIRGAYLRARQKFGLVSGGNILAAGAKLILSAILVMAGLGTIGAMSGVLLAQIIACVLIVWWAVRAGLTRDITVKKISLPNIKMLGPELRFGCIVLVASTAITLQYSLDIVIIKHYFDAHTAGVYAGIAAVARILFFLTASIPQVLISKVRLNDESGQSLGVLNKSLVLLVGLSLPVLIATIFFPEPLVNLLMGKEYTPLAGLLPMLSLSVFTVAIINLMAAYYLALRRFGIALLTAVGAGLTYIFIFLHHSSPAAVVESLLLGSAATLVSIGVWKISERRYGA
jgi:O-antigen/teichoic acid export membrane protein